MQWVEKTPVAALQLELILCHLSAADPVDQTPQVELL